MSTGLTRLPRREGLLRGVFGFVESARIPGVTGDIWAMNSNVGEWHVINGEGFYVTRLFQGDPLKVDFPAEAIPGAIMDNAPPGLGGEDFGGALVQGRDGKVYIQAGKTALWNLEVVGFDTVDRLGSGVLTVSSDDIARAEAFLAKYEQQKVGTRNVEIARMTPTFTGDIAGDFRVDNPLVFQKQDASAVKAVAAWDDEFLYLGYDVRDPSPWVNNAKTFDNMYASGDTVDFQLGTDPDLGKHDDATHGDLRLSIGSFNGEPTAVIYRRKARDKKNKKVYNSGVFENFVMESVVIVEGATFQVTTRPRSYVLEAAIPLKALGFKPENEMAIRGDFGVTHGDRGGNAFVEFLRFQDLTFSHSAVELYEYELQENIQGVARMPGALYAEGARHCAFEDCLFTGLGAYALDLEAGCCHNRVVGNTICDIAAGGIKLDGSELEGEPCRRNSHNRITDNHIHDIGRGMLSDMGAVYLLSMQPGTVVKGNLIHDVNCYNYGGWAVYPDEGASYIVIEDNICYDVSSQPFQQHIGWENQVRNNIFAFGKQGCVLLQNGWSSDHKSYVLQDNILVTDGAPVTSGGYWGFFHLDSIISDRNVIWDAGGKDLVFREIRSDYTPVKDYTLEEWRNDFKHDLCSIVADPKFKDLENRNFELEDDSPAWKIGFRKIDMSDVGPRPKGERDDGPHHLR